MSVLGNDKDEQTCTSEIGFAGDDSLNKVLLGLIALVDILTRSMLKWQGHIRGGQVWTDICIKNTGLGRVMLLICDLKNWATRSVVFF